jgi:beta-galactosidase
MKRIFVGLLLLISFTLMAQRERLLFDFGWKFALGQAHDTQKDFGHNENTFSYLAKAGYGDGAAAQKFDDRAWKTIQVPHDWCVALPFDSKGTNSHGSKAIGKNFPENSIGWYRNSFIIPASDQGRRITIDFDGVFRNSNVWINGFWVGNEPSGYNSFSYDISDYLNYGGENVIAVRVDAMMEEGWFYEGAGIYRHVWLNKTDPLHVSRYGTFVAVKLPDDLKSANIQIETVLCNESLENSILEIEEQIINPEGKIVSSQILKNIGADKKSRKTILSQHKVLAPLVWSMETPSLYRLKTLVRSKGKVVDEYETSFGIRSVRFDPNKGFFLNGKSVKIVGTNNHQDHAGVGAAIPDALQEYRIKVMKAMGSNAIRTSHNPPTPEFLDACDRLGMLVMDEHRLMGTNPEHFRQLENLMRRDRNHPSVFIWSLGNEEWYIEGDARGARLAGVMQDFAKGLDSTRAFTIACSGGWDTGIGMVTEVMGYNYLKHGNVDEHHKKFPWQSSIGTEESNTIGTRGIYTTDAANCHLAPSNIYDDGAEGGWKVYASRPFLSGLFYWTGFDYRGEPTPYGWPAVVSQFGIVDQCGYPKDIFYYFKSWWTKEPMIHLYPHWNLKGQEGKEVNVRVYSNCEEIELFLNKKSLGKKTMPVNGHLEWNVLYQQGSLLAKGYNKGKEATTFEVSTTGKPTTLQLTADKTTMLENRQDVSVITVKINDEKGRMVPDACNALSFKISGPGKIIGVGNGDPVSHEADQFLEKVEFVSIKNLRELPVTTLEKRPETAFEWNDQTWNPALQYAGKWDEYSDTLLVVRGTFELGDLTPDKVVTFFGKSITENQSLYINGKLIASNVLRDAEGQRYVLDNALLRKGKNVYAIVGKKFRRKYTWDYPNTDPGIISVYTPAPLWKRNAFNGLAQIIIQHTQGSGTITLQAESDGIKTGTISLTTKSGSIVPTLERIK